MDDLFLITATEEDGWQNKEVPDLKQPDLCCTQQILEVWGLRWAPCGTCEVLPTSYTRVSRHHYINTASHKTLHYQINEHLDSHQQVTLTNKLQCSCVNWTGKMGDLYTMKQSKIGGLNSELV